MAFESLELDQEPVPFQRHENGDQRECGKAREWPSTVGLFRRVDQDLLNSFYLKLVTE